MNPTQVETYKLQMQDRIKKLHNLFDEVNEDQLDTLGDLVTIIMLAGDAAATTANYWLGYATAKKQQRFNSHPWGKDLVSDDGIDALLDAFGE